jgi:MOSC domain-containing protein YiiM
MQSTVTVGRERFTQRRDLGSQAVLLDDPIGPDAIHQRVLVDYSTGRLDQRHQHIERAPAELQRLALGENLAAAWQNTETAKFDRRWRIGGIHDQQ